MPHGGDNRARLTVPDVVLALAAIAFIAVLYPVAQEGIAENTDTIPIEAMWLLQLVLPMVLLVWLAVVFHRALA